jgi:hypothetical protein
MWKNEDEWTSMKFNEVIWAMATEKASASGRARTDALAALQAPSIEEQLKEAMPLVTATLRVRIARTIAQLREDESLAKQKRGVRNAWVTKPKRFNRNYDCKKLSNTMMLPQFLNWLLQPLGPFSANEMVTLSMGDIVPSSVRSGKRWWSLIPPAALKLCVPSPTIIS